MSRVKMYHAMPCSVCALKRTFSLVLILWRKLDILMYWGWSSSPYRFAWMLSNYCTLTVNEPGKIILFERVILFLTLCRI